MKIFPCNEKARQKGSMIYFFVFLCIVCWTTVCLGYYVSQSTQNTQRRANMISARKYAESGVLVACQDLNGALPTNSTATIPNNMVTAGYTVASWGSWSNLYTRTVTAVFPGAPVYLQIYMSNSPTPQFATVTAQSTVGPVTESETAVVTISFLGSQGGGGAAIINVNDGTMDTFATRTDAEAGNVSINGTGGAGPLVVSGANAGMAVLANSVVNVNPALNLPASAISQTNQNTVNQIPDYTAQGTANSLFNFNQFIAIANNTLGPSSTGTDHFSNLTDFITNTMNLNPATNGALEGMVVVDIAANDPAINYLIPGTYANAGGAINIRGTLFFNFVGPGWSSSNGRLQISCGVNINAANISGVVPSNPATYTTGFPPVYANSLMNPVNINVAGLTPSYPNILPSQTLPALVYSSGIIDLHGPVDISGVVYTPNYMEIEELSGGQSQYIRGSVIVGDGIYVENVAVPASSTTISYDPNTLNNLATENNIGQEVEIAYWQ
jgi:hypothetical protein